MLLRELFDRERTAVTAFGRLNPPTIGHEHLVNKMRSISGDHYLFLSHTQNAKTDPLDFETKAKFVKKFFPDINVGHPTVKTIVQCLEYLQTLNYTNVVFVAGSDRVDSFQKMFDTYNGMPDKNGKVAFNFKSIKVVSTGNRDPDAEGITGMSASKLRQAAAQDDFEKFVQGLPDQTNAEELYISVKNGMRVGDLISK